MAFFVWQDLDIIASLSFTTEENKNKEKNKNQAQNNDNDNSNEDNNATRIKNNTLLILNSTSIDFYGQLLVLGPFLFILIAFCGIVLSSRSSELGALRIAAFAHLSFIPLAWLGVRLFTTNGLLVITFLFFLIFSYLVS